MLVKPDSLPHYPEDTDPEWDVEVRNIGRQLTNCFTTISAEMLQGIKRRKTSQANRYFGQHVGGVALGHILVIVGHYGHRQVFLKSRNEKSF